MEQYSLLLTYIVQSMVDIYGTTCMLKSISYEIIFHQYLSKPILQAVVRRFIIALSTLLCWNILFKLTQLELKCTMDMYTNLENIIKKMERQLNCCLTLCLFHNNVTEQYVLLLTSRLYYEYYRLVCIYTARTLFCSKMLFRSIMAFKAIMDR